MLGNDIIEPDELILQVINTYIQGRFCDIKIINVEIRDDNRAQRRDYTETFIILNIRKTKFNNCLTIHIAINNKSLRLNNLSVKYYWTEEHYEQLEVDETQILHVQCNRKRLKNIAHRCLSNLLFLIL